MVPTKTKAQLQPQAQDTVGGHSPWAQPVGTARGHSPWAQPEVTDLTFYRRCHFCIYILFFVHKSKNAPRTPTLPPFNLFNREDTSVFDTFPIYSLSLEKRQKKKTT
jgi:hypothetical protein